MLVIEPRSLISLGLLQKMQKSVAIGVSLTKEILAKIDTERGDISRSCYLRRLVQKAYAGDN
jgi:metal-responsive CopG/Arc/MetJ family transcriptional regulator